MRLNVRFAAPVIIAAAIVAPAAVAQTPAVATAAANKPAATAPADKAAAKRGTVNFIIRPWGEVHIGGKPYGVSPPMKAVLLPPGRHIVLIRKPGHPDYTVTIDVKSGEQHNVRHSFADAAPTAAK